MSKDEGVGIAGAMDYVPADQRGFNFYCHKCGKGHENPYGASACPLIFWCSKECFDAR